MASIPAIGIDLGTTNTCVGVYKNGKIEIIANEHGRRTTPSVVFFEEDGSKLIGDDAKDEFYKSPKNAIYDIKRIIGSSFNDLSTQKELKNLTYDVVNCEGRPKIRISTIEGTTYYYIEQICAMILKNSKKYAEDYFGSEIKAAVIAVPAYFNNSQRQATIDSAKIAGLEVLRIINEPTAAAVAYGWENKSKSVRNVLVYDFGGGTFDVSIVIIDGEKFSVKATKGDTHLGGSDIDKNVMDFIVKNLNADSMESFKNLKDKSILRIKARAVSVKEKLSSRTSCNVDFDSFQDNDYSFLLQRKQFEEMNINLFQKTIDIVEQCLADANMRKRDITDIVLVGGSSRIPKIQEMLKSCFDGKDLIKSINPDEAVAYGAALRAAEIQGGIKAKINDVIASSLSVKNDDGTVRIVVERNSPVPCQATCKRKPANDYQDSVCFEVYQGEKSLAKDNTLLGKFTIANLPPQRRDDFTFVLTFNVNYNGILFVDVVDERNRLEGNMTIDIKSNRISAEEMKRILLEEVNDKNKVLNSDLFTILN